MTTREIGKIVEQLYGHYYSPQTISVITKQLDEKVKEYHSRKITKDYAVVYADSTYINVKRGTVGKEALHILIGITIRVEGYYVSTVGLNESTIGKYIREQESHDIAIDKLTTKEYTNPFGNKQIDKPI